MDGIFHELSRRTEPAKLLGYLNFSDRRPNCIRRSLAISSCKRSISA